MDTPRLVLVRHSLPEIDPSVPASRWPLSAQGRHRCLALAERLIPYHPRVLVSSLEPKALETGQIVGGHLGMPLLAAQGLEEHDRSQVTGLTAAQFRAAVVRLLREPAHQLVMGSETAQQAGRRFAGAVDGLLAAWPGQTMVVFTHGTVMALFIAQRVGVEPVAFWQGLGLPAFAVLAPGEWQLLEVVNQAW